MQQDINTRRHDTYQVSKGLTGGNFLHVVNFRFLHENLSNMYLTIVKVSENRYLILGYNQVNSQVFVVCSPPTVPSDCTDSTIAYKKRVKLAAPECQLAKAGRRFYTFFEIRKPQPLCGRRETTRSVCERVSDLK